ncbi:DNA cytosine methyltransferase [Peptacetobacter sp. AB800]|uniref:DNA cytosine methyltransferase n=1 Tax=Peptacetobacter sp. AB800 TaxID=3388428 RepID=UPI0039FBD3C2
MIFKFSNAFSKAPIPENKLTTFNFFSIKFLHKNLNLGDITQIDLDKFNGLEVDLLTHGSPCQDFSIIGKGVGGDEGCNTRSSLMWNSVEVIKRCKPKVVIWENVKNVLSKNNIHNFEKYLDNLKNLGYTNHYKVLNSKDFGIPQNRKRIFVISILDNQIDFDFKNLKEIKMRNVFDYLENIKNEKYIIKGKMLEKVETHCNSNYKLKIIRECVNTISTKQDRSPNAGIVDLGEGRYRLLTEKECFRLMGFSDKDYKLAESVNKGKERFKNGKLYKQAGNSIVVDVLMAIFQELYLKE